MIRKLELTILLAIGACAHPALDEPRPVPSVVVLTAQAPHRFKITEHVPSTIGAGSIPITYRESVTLASVSSRDSAGGTIWQLTVDSTSSVIVPRDGIDPAQLTGMQIGRVWIAQPSRYRAFVSDTRAVALQTDGRVVEAPFLAQYPEWSLLLQLYPFSCLPRAALTVPVGQTRVDTSVAQRPLPSGIWNYTTIATWTRRNPSLIEGTYVCLERFASDSSRAFGQEGKISVRLDRRGSVLEVRLEERVRP